MWRELKTRELATTALMLVACAAPAVAQDDSMPQGKRPTVSRAAAPSSSITATCIRRRLYHMSQDNQKALPPKLGLLCFIFARRAKTKSSVIVPTCR